MSIFNRRLRDMLTFSDGDTLAYAEIHLAGTAATEQDGLVQKEIMRTGHWDVVPTLNGLQKRPLTIIRDGKSDKERGIISLSELVENFKRVGQRVQIPLTDDNNDHKNTIRLNTGFVHELKIIDTEKDSRLVAIMKFTEDDVKGKVLRGTYADVSCGIPWEFRSRGENYGAYLEHVAITNRPFIDDLGPFLALSDGPDPVEREITHFSVPTEPPAPQPPAPVAQPQNPAPPAPQPPEVRIVDPYGGLSLREIEEQGLSILPEEMRETFRVIDVKAKGIVVKSDEAKQSWLVPFKVEEGKLAPSTEGWSYIKYEGEAKPTGDPKAPDPSPDPAPPAPPAPASGDPQERDLEAARRLRRQRLDGVSAAYQYPIKEGAHMPLTREELERLDLSAMPDDQRAVIQKLLNDNSDLAMSSKEASANERIAALEEMGFKGHPGALKLYRQVMLGDDEAPAVIVLADDGKKQSLTALDILDQFIEAIKGAEGKVVFSDQATLVPDDPKPPITPEGEKTPFDDRLAATKAALAGVHGA